MSSGVVISVTALERMVNPHAPGGTRHGGRARRRGIAVHAAIARHMRGISYPPRLPDPEAGAAWQRFLSSRFAHTNAIGAERPFALRFPHGVVRGRMDAVFPTGEPAFPHEVVDFKTGENRAHECGLWLQLPLYALASWWSDDVPVRYTYVFLTTGREVTCDQNEVRRDALIARVDAVLAGIGTWGTGRGGWHPQSSPSTSSASTP